MDHRQEVYEEARKKWMQKFSNVREMLNTVPGKQLLTELRETAMNPPGGIYAEGSFDRTAFNLGVLFVYQLFENIAKGTEDATGR